MIVNMIKNAYQRGIDLYRHKTYVSYIHEIKKRDKNKYRLTETEKKEIQCFWKRKGYHISTYDWHEYLYGATGIHSVEFVPEDLFHITLLPKYNRIGMAEAWMDKAYLKIFLEDTSIPDTILSNVDGVLTDGNRNIISVDEANEILANSKEYIVKPTIDSGEGKGVKLKNFQTNGDIEGLTNEYDQNYIVQSRIIQHKKMAQWNRSTLNTIRVTSCMKDGMVYILSAFFRIGDSLEIADNAGRNRGFVGVKTNGELMETGIDYNFYQIASWGGLLQWFFNSELGWLYKNNSKGA